MPRALRLALALPLAVSAALFVLWSLHWPLVGDASLIHYMAFLIQRGWAPYRDFADMNMPGSFLIELAAIKLFGGGALGLRLFDFVLLAAAGAAFLVLLRRAGWFPALFAGALLALVHGRDGIMQAGQRDLTMGVLLVLGTASMLLAIERRSPWAMASFGLCSGLALTIKPTVLPLVLAQLALAVWVLGRQHRRMLLAALTILLAPLAAFIFLLRQHAVQAFGASLSGLVAYYVSLAHRPIGFLLLHSISPLLPLVIGWLLVLALARPRLDTLRLLLLFGVLFGFVSYLLQARGMPYYRYPLLCFLLPLLALDFTEAATHGARKPAGLLSIAALVLGAAFLAPQSAWLIHSYRRQQTDFTTTLEQNLTRLGGPALSGHIQCVDSISGCTNALYDLRLLPATGILLDFPLFGAPDNTFVRQSQADFAARVFAHPPPVIVVSSDLYVDGPGDYRKLDRWPALTSFLAHNYTLDTDWHPQRTQRWWSREEFPASYRIYVLRN